MSKYINRYIHKLSIVFSIVLKNLVIVLLLTDNSLRARRVKNIPDLTIVSPMKFSDGLFRMSIGLIESLCDNLNISFQASGLVDLAEVPQKVQSIVSRKSTQPGRVALLLDSPWHVWDTPARYMPKSEIKLAYSMLEGTHIPQNWVTIFNKQFDAVIVPDDFLVQVYQASGVKIPVFVIPIGLYLENLLARPIKQAPDKTKHFVFGSSAFFSPGKNQEMVIRAFAQEFGNNPKVSLKLHGRYGETAQLYKLIDELKVTNIEIIQKSFANSEHTDFMASLDCYVLLSHGEGFSNTPREALALGVPCIISDNTAHKTITKTGFVCPVPSDILVPAHYVPLGGYCGYKFACTQEDAAQALRTVYEQYEEYLHKAHAGRQWVKQYLYSNVKKLYATLCKPQKITLGTYNKITPEGIITKSGRFYKKYKRIFNI